MTLLFLISLASSVKVFKDRWKLVYFYFVFSLFFYYSKCCNHFYMNIFGLWHKSPEFPLFLNEKFALRHKCFGLQASFLNETKISLLTSQDFITHNHIRCLLDRLHKAEATESILCCLHTEKSNGPVTSQFRKTRATE